MLHWWSLVKLLDICWRHLCVFSKWTLVAKKTKCVPGLCRIAWDYSHGIIFNCSKTVCTTFKAKSAKSNVTPLLTLAGQNVKSACKYLRIAMDTEFSDDKDIQRQLRYEYCAANKLRASFSRCSIAVKMVKMYFFVPFVRPCMHHNFGVISGSHACRECVWPIIFDAELYTTCPGEGVLVATRFNVTFLPLRPCYDKIRRLPVSRKDAESPTTYCYVFDAVRLFVFVLILWALQSHFTLWMSDRTLQCAFDWWRVMSQCIRILPGLEQFRNWHPTLQ